MEKEVQQLQANYLVDQEQSQSDERQLIELIKRQHDLKLKRKRKETEALVHSLGNLKDRHHDKRARLDQLQQRFDDSQTDFTSRLNTELTGASRMTETFDEVYLFYSRNFGFWFICSFAQSSLDCLRARRVWVRSRQAC